MSKFYNKNMEVLKLIDKTAYNIVHNTVITSSKYEILETKIGEPTLQITILDSNNLKEQKFLLHSKYDPYRTEHAFVDKNVNSTSKNMILYGFGLGYHIELLLKRIVGGQSIYIIEANIEIVKIAFMIRDLTYIITHKQIKFIFLTHQYNLTSKLSLLKDKDSSLIVHQSSAKAIPPKYKSIGDLLKDFNMMNWGIKKNQELLLDNYLNNIKIRSTNISTLFGKYKNMPIVIVSAGPSLNRNKHLLHKIKDKALIFSVGSALKVLVKEGIVPHLFCITDPQPLTYKQIEGYENLSVPLVYLETTSHLTVSKHQGLKYIAFNDRERVQENEQVIETGGSVATAILDISLKFGGNPIIFIGQDLAFTDYEHHAEGSMYGEEKIIKDLPNLKKVKGHNGEIYPTSSSLLSFKNWIERKIEKHQEVIFINATEKGAMIKGCKHMTFENAINLYIRENSKELNKFLDILKTDI